MLITGTVPVHSRDRIISIMFLWKVSIGIPSVFCIKENTGYLCYKVDSALAITVCYEGQHNSTLFAWKDSTEQNAYVRKNTTCITDKNYPVVKVDSA
jgi:hypothetical protein